MCLRAKGKRYMSIRSLLFFFLALLIHLLETLNNATANNAALDKEHISKSNDSSPLNGNIC